MSQSLVTILLRNPGRIAGPCALCGTPTADISEPYTVAALTEAGQLAPVCTSCRDRDASDLANLADVGRTFFASPNSQRAILAAVAAVTKREGA